MKKTPYLKYKESLIWEIIEKELKELEENQDLEITTLPDIVVGSLVKAIKESGVLKDDLS